MNHNLSISLIIFCLIFGLGAVASASRVGNGGDGVIMGDKVYLLDLVEAGIEESPYFDPTTAADSALEARLLRHLPFLDAESAALIARKLKEIEALDRAAVWVFMKTLELYNWIYIKGELLDVPDEETTLKIPRENLVQLAVRSGKRIQVNRDNWAKLSPAHRAALIFHEVVYAFITPEPAGKGQRQSSPKTREFVSLLFSERMKMVGARGFRSEFAAIFPLPFHRLRVDGDVIVGQPGTWHFSWARNRCEGASNANCKKRNHDYTWSSFKETEIHSAIADVCELASMMGRRSITLHSIRTGSAPVITLGFWNFTDEFGYQRVYVAPSRVNDETRTVKLKDTSFSYSYSMDCRDRGARILAPAWKRAFVDAGFYEY